MKNMKKILALLVAIMILAASMSALAAGDATITINNAVTGHTYTAYQILKGTLSGDKLSNVDWGNGITGDGKTALYTKYNLTGDNQTPAKVAEAIAAENDAIAFANAVGTNVGTGTAGTLSGTTYTISGLEDGYYMIVDTWTGNTSAVEGKDYSLARYMVQLAGTAIVNNKADKPTVEKKIDGATDTDPDTTGKVDYNTANIGDTVPYVVTSAVPNYVDYKEYYMDFSDTLSKGLTFNSDSVVVKIGGTTLAADAYVVTVGTYSETAGTAISIHLKDLVSRSSTYAPGATIEITYSATLNDKAVIGAVGNPNTVKLEYTNNPLQSGDGTPDNNEDIVKGETPEDKVTTFVTELELTKVDGANTATKLAGAVFKIKGTRINKVLMTGDHFVEDADGTYYKLKDNKGYTDKAPTANTEAQYASTTVKYKKQAFGTQSVEETKDVEFEAVTGSDGIIKLTGIATGTYTFTEIQAPAGYNLLGSPIVVEVGCTLPTDPFDGTQTATWTATGANVDATTGKITFTVENKAGSTLPATGGIGTTIFYVAGSILVLAAVILLVTKRRMGSGD